MSFILLGILNSQAAGAGAAPAMDLIDSTVLSASGTTITFTSIPADYKHLKIRINARGTTSGTHTLHMKFNNSSANYWAMHRLAGNGSTVNGGTDATSTSGIRFQAVPGSDYGANLQAVYDIEILDFATDKTKVARGFNGIQGNFNFVALQSGMWNDTSAINRLDFSLSSGSFAANTNVAIYGLRA